MLNEHPSRASYRREHRPQTPINFHQLWRFFKRLFAWCWRLLVILMWAAGFGSLIAGGLLLWYGPDEAAAPNATALASSAKQEDVPADDARFAALDQTQQLGLLARWSNQQAAGNFKVYMGEANTIYFKHDVTTSWRANTVKVVDNHDGTYTSFRPQSDAAHQDSASVQWVPADAISQGKLLRRYQNALSDYANRIDLSTRTQANPTKE